MRGIILDIRHALRRLIQTPGFAFSAVLTLALGIGATTLVYSVIQSVLLNSLPFRDANRLVVLSEAANGEDFSVAWPNFEDWRMQAHCFEGMAGYALEHFQYFDGEHTILPRAMRASAAFFTLLRAQPIAGRVFTAAEDRAGGPAVVVLGYRFWQNELHGDPAIVGRTLNLSGEPYTVIGIMPPRFQYFYGQSEDFYVSLGQKAADSNFNSRTAHGSMRVLARLAPGASETAARTEMEGIAARLAEQFPETNRGHSVMLSRLTDNYFAGIRSTLWMLQAAVLLVLLVACANVSNLLLAQGADRAREYAIRSAIGAGAYRIFRQCLAESLCLALIAGACGVMLVYLGLPLVLHLAPESIPRLGDTEVGRPVLAFAVGVSVAVAILCAILPAFASLRIRPEQALKTSSALATRGRQFVRTALLTGGVAVTVILTAATGLLIESLQHAMSSEPGFESEHLLSLDIVLSTPKYANKAAATAFFDAALEKMKAVPGVTEAASVFCPPMAGDCWDYFYSVPGRVNPSANDLPLSLFNIADRNYFRAAGIKLIAGRVFSSVDTADSLHVAIVNRTFANRWWATENAVGHTIRYGGRGEAGDLLEIVGVVDDIRQFGLDAAPEPEVFFPASQQRRETMVLMARTAGNPAILASAAEEAVHTVDREVPVRIHPMSAVVTDSLRQRKFVALLFSLFGGIALLLAGLGIFGMAAYFVASRKAEIGLRVALGARPDQVRQWVCLHTLQSAVVGCVSGILLCFALLPVIRNLLYMTSTLNPLVLVGTSLLLIAIALMATWLPARRATLVDPMDALRRE
jgi:putative ABC transport system permease protein